MFNRNRNIFYRRRIHRNKIHRNKIYKNRIHKSKINKSILKVRNTGRFRGQKAYVYKINKRLIYFYILLFIITFGIVGLTLNRIELHIAINKVKAEGIDYDSFREMLIPVKTIQEIKNQIKNEEVKNEEVKSGTLKEKRQQNFDAADYLTLSMLLNGYKLNKDITIGKRNMNYLLENLTNNESFKELKEYYAAIFKDIECFPVSSKSGSDLNITFIDTWNAYRSYGGNRRHEGTDLMSKENIRGVYPVISMTDGTVEKMGWLEQGGYRIGIRGIYGAYYYYAHLDSYAPDLEIGDTIKAGEFLGYMGDSGYGPEGTVGKFDVHLHVGIYVKTDFGELSVNPYWILRYLEIIQ